MQTVFSRTHTAEAGKVIYGLKNQNKNGTTHVIFEPLDFIARLAALVLTPWMNLTRFHGVFAPNSKYRKAVTGYDKSSAREDTQYSLEMLSVSASKEKG